ncbi:MAG: MlaD family protein [Candidatus Gastranaerophilales bacterium]|nr:MlaD family protein [Candidatus Gastranaerophilales bacterium]
MEKSERKSRTSRLRRIELSIWLVILLVFVSIAIFMFYRHEESFETHRIKMPDVDGLIVGSPVNLMGIPVGYVTKTKIMNDDEVLVKFKLTNRNVHIQKGTVATVEFSGLGGSKSLELYPPSNNKTVTKELLVNKYDDYILVERPKRLRDCWTLLYQMYKKIVTIAYSLSSFGQELDSAAIIPSVSNTVDTINFINYADNWLDNSHSNMKNFRKILERKDNKK